MPRPLRSALCLAVSTAVAAKPLIQPLVGKPRHPCGLCRDLLDGVPCDYLDACGEVGPTDLADGCQKVCSLPQAEAAAAAALRDNGIPDFRVVKAFGSKPYNQVRISVISTSAVPPAEGFFDYSRTFAYKWTQYTLHSAIKTVNAGEETHFNLGTDVSVNLPPQGAGVSGMLIADPCTNFPNQWMYCGLADQFQTATRTPGLINAFGPHVDFWALGGDNWYDRDGYNTAQVFSQISPQAKSKLLATVPGNHDFWVYGSPESGTTNDQCAHGFMQFYAQDTKVAEHLGVGSTAAPFNLTVHPDEGRAPFLRSSVGLGCNLPDPANFFWYNQIGNVGLVGQSGAHTFAEAGPFMREACSWAARQPGLDVLVLLGHWDTSGLGASAEMAMPAWYTEMAALPGCSDYHARGMLKFVMGHTHCNDPHPHGNVGAGFRVAGFGMYGCNNYGMPVMDTTGGRVRFWYFDTMSDTAYYAVHDCVTASGWRACTNLATLWLDEPLVPSPTPPAPSPSPPPSPSPAGCPVPPDNGGCCASCSYNRFCPANHGCYAAGQPGCPGTLCPPPPVDAAVVL